MPERQRSWKPPTEAEREKKRAEREQQRRQTLKENLWEKVEQGLKDLWRPYHGSTKHREDSDGNQLIEKKKSGGHTPLNAAVMQHWEPKTERGEKIADARTELTKRLYRLATGEPFEVVCFAEIRDLFGSYGAGDSDLDELRRTASYHGPASEAAAKLRAVEQGIDRIVEMLIKDGFKNPHFWADFPLPGVPSDRSKGVEDKDRERYERMLDEERPDLVMFDSWIGFLAAEGRDENASNDISAWADAYSKPALRRGTAVLVLDHVPHDLERERGSTRKRDEVDVAWKLTKLGDFDREKTGTLAMTRMKDREGWLPERLTFEIGGEPGAGFVMRRDDNLAPVEVTHTSRKERVALEALRDGGMKAGEWREAVAAGGEEIPQRTFYRMRDELLEKGKILKDGQLHVLAETTTSSGVPTLPNLATAKNDIPQDRGAPETVPTVPPPKGVASQVGTVSSEASAAPDEQTLPPDDGTTSGVGGFGATKEDRIRKYEEMKRKLRERKDQ